VIVGVDGSDIALRAVCWGAAEAGRRRVPLRLVLAFTAVPDHLVGHRGLGQRTRESLLDRARAALQAAATAG
jgi:nucleotide-binding universal stress UspA family protein